jgi:hypothetical protein
LRQERQYPDRRGTYEGEYSNAKKLRPYPQDGHTLMDGTSAGYICAALAFC